MIKASTLATAVAVLVTGVVPISGATPQDAPRWICNLIPFLCSTS